uniref:NADH-ubiquinone oxidoreductase chain 6 n=1 Tax=Hemipeplus sp. HEM01 TaxID=1205628 RepID=A0A0S2MSA9_9CUCU|nr:NADH deshydrogenase subunit 6 [Hemipeplus sp. HEM01]
MDNLIQLSILTSITFLFITHPLSLGVTLLIQTSLVALISGNLSLNFWFSYIIFLIMVGGMLILFIYMTSIASNEKFSLSWNLTFMILIFTSMSIMLYTQNYFLKTNIMNYEQLSILNSMIQNFSLNKYINMPLMIIMMLAILYLLITLIAVVKITSFKYGPLRQMN